MSGDVSGAGSVEVAVAELLAEHDDWRCRATCGRDGRWNAPDTHPAHQAAALADAGLLAAPVPAADADEVEVLAPIIRTLLGADWDLVPSECARSAERSSARDLLAALAPIRAAEVAAAEERGRRAGLAEAAARLRRLVDIEEASDDHAGMTRAAELLDETAPTTNDD